MAATAQVPQPRFCANLEMDRNSVHTACWNMLWGIFLILAVPQFPHLIQGEGGLTHGALEIRSV